MGGASHARAGLGSAGRGLLQAWVLLQGEALWGWRGGGLLPRLCFSPFRPDVFLFKDISPKNIPHTHTPVHPYTPNTLWKQNQAFSPSERGACMGENKKVQGRGGRRFWPAFGAGEPEADGLFSSQGVDANPALLAQLKALCSPCSSIHPSEHGTPMFRQPNPTGGSWI